MIPESTNLWSRPCGIRDVLRLALPMIISAGSWTLMHFIDRMFLFWYSTDAFAAAMPAGILSFAVACFPLGMTSYTNTFVAQYHGASAFERIGTALWQGIRVSFVFMLPLLLTIPAAPAMFNFFGHDQSLVTLEIPYYQILMYGSCGMVLGAALSSFYTGRGLVMVVMIVNIVTTIVNLVLDYAWIFGKLGFPEMGIEGAGWATVVAQWFKVLLYVVLMFRKENLIRFGLWSGRKHSPELWRRMWRFGSVSGLQMVIEMAAFTIFIQMVGGLGKEAMAATTLAFNINGVAFMPLIGLGIAVSTIVGQQLGAGRPDLATRGSWTAFALAVIYTSAFAALYILAPELTMIGHAWGSDPERFKQVIPTAVILLRFVAVYCLFDAMNITFVNVLKGAGDTRFILWVASITSPIPVVIAWIGIHFYGLGLYWCWYIITAWICGLGIIYFARFLQGGWKSKHVIESKYLPPTVSTPPEPPVIHEGDRPIDW